MLVKHLAHSPATHYNSLKRPRLAILAAKKTRTEVDPGTSDGMRLLNTALGYVGWAVITATLVVPLSTFKALQLAVEFIFEPFMFFHKADRSGVKLDDPLPNLEYKTLDLSLQSPGGVKLLAVSTGKPKKGSRGLMLCVHGFPEGWHSWKNQMKEFRDEYEVVAIQLRGYGGSEVPKGVHSYRLARLADDLRDAVRALGYQNAVVLAHDWGGAIAWNFLYLNPQMVTAAVIMAGPHPVLAKKNFSFSQLIKSYYIFLFQAPFIPEIWLTSFDYRIAEAMTEGYMGCLDKEAISDDDLARYKQMIAQPGAISGMVNYYRALFRNATYAPEKELRGIYRKPLPMPVLCLPAELDGALNVDLWNGAEALGPDVSVEVVKNSSHWVQQDAAPKVNDLVRAFLKKRKLI